MSHESVPPDPALNAVEAALKSLVPAGGGFDRDRVMFLAGRAAERRSLTGGRAWGAVAACLGLVALGETALLVYRPPERVVERVFVAREPAAARIDPMPVQGVPESSASFLDGLPVSLGRTPYERLAGQVLRYGLDGLSTPPTAASPSPVPSPASSGRLMREELDRFLEPGGPS